MDKELAKQPEQSHDLGLNEGIHQASDQMRSFPPPPLELEAGTASGLKEPPLQRVLTDKEEEEKKEPTASEKLEENLDHWHDRLESKGKKETLNRLRILKGKGAIKGKTLLYLGGDADIEHPLFATPATHLTFVGLDPEQIKDPKTAEANRSKEHGRHLKDIGGKLERTGLKFVVKDLTPNHISQIQVLDESKNPMITIEYHTKTYSEYQKTLGDKQFDIVIDKDSWLKIWQNSEDEGVPTAIAPMVQEGGLWMGGFSSKSDKAMDMTDGLFEDETDLVGDGQKWSGYEDMHLRIRNGNEVGKVKKKVDASFQKKDPVWESIKKNIFPMLEEHLDRKDKSFGKAGYNAMIGVLEYSLPYIKGIDMKYCAALAKHIHEKIKAFTISEEDAKLITEEATLKSFKGFLAE